jgi:hypothetical protein
LKRLLRLRLRLLRLHLLHLHLLHLHLLLRLTRFLLLVFAYLHRKIHL